MCSLRRSIILNNSDRNDRGKILRIPSTKRKNLGRQAHRQLMTNIRSIRRTEGRRRRNFAKHWKIQRRYLPRFFSLLGTARSTHVAWTKVFHTPLTFSHVSSRRNALRVSLSRRSRAPRYNGILVTVVGIQATHIFKALSRRQRSPHCRTRR